MGEMKIALLPDRGLIRVAGEDAEKFLQGLLTNSVTGLVADRAVHAALLSPQGKILFDLLVAPMATGGFGLDVAQSIVPDLIKRLAFYKLRAKVTIEDCTAAYRVGACWGGIAPAATGGAAVTDTRHKELGQRLWIAVETHDECLAALGVTPDEATAYHAHRIALGIPEGGKDFAFGDAFPHEADMDQFHGVDFSKGCYVGQEVVSRMQHRGSARKRVVPVEGVAPLPPSGSAITAGTASIGTLGSVAGKHGLALLRLDRAEEAQAKGEPLLAAGTPVSIRWPAWWPPKDKGAPS